MREGAAGFIEHIINMFLMKLSTKSISMSGEAGNNMRTCPEVIELGKYACNGDDQHYEEILW